MKKFLILLLTLTIAIFCAGCGTFTPPIVTNPGNTGEGGNNTPIDPDIDPDAFTVVLLRESGARFYPDPDMNIKAAWTGQGESYSASFGLNGIAAISGLDGTYNVSLTNVPEGYTFDPNQDYTVYNDHRSVSIMLMAIIDAEGEGTNFYADSKDWSKQIKNTGLYRAEIKSPNQRVCYTFQPNENGTYLIESFVNVHENAVNPILDYLVSNGSYVNEANPTTFDTGGSSGSFTKNFRFYADKVAGFTGSWGLAIRASVQPGHSYPVYVDFRISYLYDSPNDGVNVKANGPFVDDTTGNPEGNFTYIYMGEGSGESADKYIDDYKVKLYWTDNNGNGIYDKDDGGDGFYHVLPQSEYNKEYSAIEWGSCPILYARIFLDSEVLPSTPIHQGLLWHRAHIILDGETDKESHSPGYYEEGTCYLGVDSRGTITTNAFNLVLGNRTYYGFVHTYYVNLCNYVNKTGNSSKMKNNGTVPVNAELKRFLEDFAKINETTYDDGTAPLFDDGKGTAEGRHYSVAGPDSVWLFCCGYFGDTIAYSH